MNKRRGRPRKQGDRYPSGRLRHPRSRPENMPPPAGHVSRGDDFLKLIDFMAMRGEQRRGRNSCPYDNGLLRQMLLYVLRNPTASTWHAAHEVLADKGTP